MEFFRNTENVKQPANQPRASFDSTLGLVEIGLVCQHGADPSKGSARLTDNQRHRTV